MKQLGRVWLQYQRRNGFPSPQPLSREERGFPPFSLRAKGWGCGTEGRRSGCNWIARLISVGVEDSACQGLDPAQPGLRGGGGLVLAADPAAVAQAVDVAEQPGVVDLPGAGLMPPRVVGELDVGDARQVDRKSV